MNDVVDFAKRYAETLVELGEIESRVVVVDSDLCDSCSTEAFGKVFPNRTWDIGIAEQNLPLVSVGLAMAGLIPFYNSFAVFSVHRGIDMIRQSIAYNQTNVKIVGHAAGQSMGYVGPSHHTLEDIAILRAIPGIGILQPSDGEELRQMMHFMVQHEGPLYLRIPRIAVPDYHNVIGHTRSWTFRYGEPEVVRDGSDITVFATGELVSEFLLQVDQFEEILGLSIRLVNVATLKPVNIEKLVALGKDTLGAVTLEDHSRIGGLGSLVAEAYAEFLCKPVKRIGIDDTFTESASGRELRERYGMDRDRIITAILDIADGARRKDGTLHRSDPGTRVAPQPHDAIEKPHAINGIDYIQPKDSYQPGN